MEAQQSGEEEACGRDVEMTRMGCACLPGHGLVKLANSSDVKDKHCQERLPRLVVST